jgi:hypothetical protein
LTAVKDGNCFVEGSDFAAVNRVAVRLHHEGATALPTTTRCFSWSSVAISYSCVGQR